jgi:methyl-accepting chemotaxis protein
MELSVKLLGGFILVAVIGALIGVFGIWKIQVFDEAGTAMYQLNTKPLGEIGDVAVGFQRTRVNLRDMLVGKFVSNEDINTFIKRTEELGKSIDEDLKVFEKSIKPEEVRKEFESLKNELARFHPIEDKIIASIKDGKKDEALAMMRGEGFQLAGVG